MSQSIAGLPQMKYLINICHFWIFATAWERSTCLHILANFPYPTACRWAWRKFKESRQHAALKQLIRQMTQPVRLRQHC